MKTLKICLFCICIILMVSCKSTRSVTTNGEIDKNLTARQLIKENSRKDASFKTLQAKVKIDVIEDLRESSYTVQMRMEKDKTIWLSATLGLARALITPKSVKFYDKINNQYFDGDFELLSNLLGVDLDFEKVQSLLIGEPLFNLKEGKYAVSVNEASYILQPKEQDTLLELFLLFNPSHFKIDSQQLLQPIEKRFLQIDYLSYQEVDKEILPKHLKIIALEASDEFNVVMEYKSVSINKDVRFPFNIPSGFKEIILEDVK